MKSRRLFSAILKRNGNRPSRILVTEILEKREMLASDLEGFQIGSIPKAPEDVVQADRARYAAMASGISPITAPIVSLADTFALHSRPSATKTIYLDFDGFTARGTPWNSSRNRDPIVSPAWDPDSDGPAFSVDELKRIQGIWQRVTADFSAFDVNVTTEDPGEAALVNTGGNDDRWGIRVVFTGDDFPLPGSGGVAFINSFNWGYNRVGATDTPCYVFNLGEVDAAGAASHEVGHSLGLSHDGTTSAHPFWPSQEYYPGHGSGENGWGPIMGVGGYYHNVTTWDNGVYFASNNGGASANFGRGPDDLQIITSNNGFGYVPDIESDTIGSAVSIDSTVDSSTGVTRISQFGVISRSDDVDVFRLQTGTGKLNLIIDPYVNETFVHSGGNFSRSIADSFLSTFWDANQGSNLDIQATLYDSNGNVIAVSDPDGLRASFADIDVVSGVYYVAVDGVGFGDPTANPPTGYTDYASIGQYLITGTVPITLGLILPTEPFTYTENSPPVQVAGSATLVDIIPGDYSDGQLDVLIVPTPGSTDKLYFDPGLTGLVNVGGLIRLGNVLVATLTSSSPTQLSFRFNANTNASVIEKLVMSIRFEATGDGPDTAERAVGYRLKKGVFSVLEQRAIRIVQLNDAPQLLDSKLPSVPEDSLPTNGQTIAGLFEGRLVDPDPGARLTGVAVVANTTPTSEGRWQIRLSPAGIWRDLPTVSMNQRLALSGSSRIRFIPGRDFFGDATPLQVLAIDNSFTGAFSSEAVLEFLPLELQGPDSPVAMLPASLGIYVSPVNDAPVPAVTSLRYSVVQNELLLGQIPNDAVRDVDDTVFSYSAVQSDGRPLPSWLQLNSGQARFEGTPGIFDVRTYELIMTVTDFGGLSTRLPVFIDVIDVNDAPIQLRYSSVKVPEATTGVQIGRLFAIDQEGDEIIWTVSDPRFTVQGNQVFVNTEIDYETDQSIPVTFRATDSGIPPLSAELQVVLAVEDLNEFYPELAGDTFTITTGTAVGSLLKQLVAPDGDTLQTVRYRMRDGDTQAFQLNSDTGHLRLAIEANAAVRSEYRVFIEAYDSGTPRLAKTAQFNLFVLPVNDFAPVITPGQVLEFRENLPAGSDLGRILATDADGTPLLYELIGVTGGSTNWVGVDANTGQLKATALHRFDFESQVNFAIQVRVSEKVTPFRSIEGTIPVRLLNANDPPAGLEPVSIYVSRQGDVASPIIVIDQDIAQGGYSFSTDDPRFEIRQGRLALRPDRHFDSGQGGTSTSTVLRVIDNGDPSSQATLTLVVNILAGAAWQNPIDRLDTNRDQRVSSLDALVIINVLNGLQVRQLDVPRRFDQLQLPDYDVNGDNRITSLDALLVINHLNARSNSGGGEGESDLKPVRARKQIFDADTWLQAFSQLEDEKRRRKIE